MAANLEDAGFVAGFDDTSVKASRSSATIVRFGPDGVESARLLATYLDQKIQFEYVSTLPGRRVEVAYGADAPSVRETPLAPDAISPPTIPAAGGRRTTTTVATASTTPRAGATTTTQLDGSTTSTSILAGGTTTTTQLGVVPISADGSSKCG